MDLVAQIKRNLEVAGFPVAKCERLPNNHGHQLRCQGGEIVNVFDTGRVSVQGKNQEKVNEVLGLAGSPAVKTQTPVSRKVFVVYGHDTTAKSQLEATLRRWCVEPIILDQLTSEGDTLIEKLERYLEDGVQYAVVLATPDDEGYPRGRPTEKRYRARQNVVLELGVLLSKLGRRRVAILLKDQVNMERPSDIDGLIYIKFRDRVDEATVALAKEMKVQGIDVDIANL